MDHDWSVGAAIQETNARDKLWEVTQADKDKGEELARKAKSTWPSEGKGNKKGEKTKGSDWEPNPKWQKTGEGKGGAAGFAKGGADVRLEDSETGTRLIYDVEAKVGGKLAQLGSRIVDGFAKKMADQFFSNLEEVIEGPKEDEPEEQAEKKGWLKRMISKG